MPHEYTYGENVVYTPEMYDQQDAIFLHKKGDRAFIRLEDTHELKLVDLRFLNPTRS